MEKIYEIKNNEYTAKINLSRGANCISLRNSKYAAKILREPDYSKELDNPYLYGMPILYPVNRISGGKFEFEDREYVFPINEPSTNCHIHGELHNTEFSVIDKGKDYIICAYKSNGEYLDFPHKFRIVMTYTLKEDGLYQEIEIENLSDKNMPNFLGFHTTFNIPFAEGANSDDITILTEVGDEIERNMSVYLPTGKFLPLDEITKKMNEGTFKPFEQVLSRHYKVGTGRKIEIRDTTQKVKVVYENDEKYTFRLIYNGNADEYICLEPMNCMANCQNSPFDRDYAGFDYIEPGKSKTYISVIKIEEI